MKMHVDRYRESLGNMLVYLARKRTAVAQAQMDVERTERDVALLKLQIEEADARGMKEFDAEKLLVPRKRKAKTP